MCCSTFVELCAFELKYNEDLEPNSFSSLTKIILGLDMTSALLQSLTRSQLMQIVLTPMLLRLISPSEAQTAKREEVGYSVLGASHHLHCNSCSFRKNTRLPSKHVRIVDAQRVQSKHSKNASSVAACKSLNLIAYLISLHLDYAGFIVVSIAKLDTG